MVCKQQLPHSQPEALWKATVRMKLRMRGKHVHMLLGRREQQASSGWAQVSAHSYAEPPEDLHAPMPRRG